MIVRRLSTLLAVMVAAALLGGCASGEPQISRYTINVAVSERLQAADNETPVEVDIVGLNPDESAQWENFSLSRYFAGDHPLRQGADRKTLRFGEEDERIQILTPEAEIWEKWEAKGATRLFILANLPGIERDRPGEQDVRRLILPLDRRQWRTSTIEIEVDEAAVRRETPLRSEE